jgi:uncharacterized protein YndB with AHSA1/START domain
MTLRRLLRPLLLVAAAAPAAFGAADVVAVAENGFTSKNTVTVPVDPARAYAAVVEQVGKWWDPAHTFSRDSANLSIEASPQGCFCEKLPEGGFVRHLTVVFAAPGRMLRLEGGLGPFQSLGVAGSLTWTFQPGEKGGTTVQLTYTAGGYSPTGFKDLAPAADGMLRGQLERYARYLSTGKP